MLSFNYMIKQFPSSKPMNIKSLVLFLILILSIGLVISTKAQTPIAPSLGDGSVANPYQIATIDNLAWLQASSNSSTWSMNYIQTADIDASVTASWNGGAGFSPIGNSSIKFTGSYDGQRHTFFDKFIM